MNRNALLTGIRVGLLLVVTGALVGCTTGRAPAGNAAPTTLPKQLTINLGGGATMEFVLIPAGAFRMGSIFNPPHKVTIFKPFYTGKYEVTQEQWQLVMGTNPSFYKGAKNPVDSVSWDDCQTFIAKLKEKVPHREFSLPSEAQWEYACRGGRPGMIYLRDEAGGLDDYAWFNISLKGGTHPVGMKKPNPWGLYDMHGNVAEWCQDVDHGSYKNAPTDGSAWIDNGRLWGGYTFRILRGCSFLDNDDQIRFADIGYAPPFRTEDVMVGMGLRLVLAVEKP